VANEFELLEVPLSYEVNMKLYKNLAPIFFAMVSLFFTSCSEDNDDFGEYYERTFIDSVIVFSDSDTINIVLEQARTQFQKEKIPYSIEIKNNTDSIRLKLFVSFGSYENNPNPLKEISEISDTIYVWYSLRKKMSKAFYKNNSITEANTSPRISYISIDSIVVQRGQDKRVNLLTRIIE
jgi:hypothetical protein